MSRTGPLVIVGLMGILAITVMLWKPHTNGTAAETPQSPMPTRFAEDRNAPGGNVKSIAFDGKRAIGYLKQLCEIGTRISGSDGMKKQQDLLTKHFEAHGAKVTRQEFDAKQYSKKEKVRMTNLIAAWHPERTRRIMLCSHYDTRPMAHEEPNRASWNRPFLSANDGTSGIAFFMELAHHMKDLQSEYGIDFVCFDGEEYIFEPRGPLGGGDKFFFGSEHFGSEYAKGRGTRKQSYDAAILFDLFAHKGAKFPIEGNSWNLAPTLSEQLWKVAAAVGAKSFEYKLGGEVSDDHLALNAAGIPAVDIIDFEGYRAHWHRLTDTVEQCSDEQMNEVAKVITTWLQVIQVPKQ